MKHTVPLTVPLKQKKEYLSNYAKVTHKSNNLFLFAADQKIEHLNKDFYGEDIPKECNNPEHLFKIAQESKIGAFATNLGLVARYGKKYKKVNYIIKLNAKTNIVPTEQKDPLSTILYSVEDIVQLKEESKLSIVGVGYTIYLGSTFESKMLHEAAQVVLQAHKHGLLAILWIYPRGKAVKQERTEEIIAGAAGVGACLGADFVKVNPPLTKNNLKNAELLQQATTAAGNTKVICAGGTKITNLELLNTVHDQITLGKTSGCAIGRNIFQNNLEDAIILCEALASVIIDGKDVAHAKKLLKNRTR